MRSRDGVRAEPFRRYTPLEGLALRAAAARHASDAPVAEIAICIWTTCAGIVQTYIANPSKRAASLAIFNRTRQKCDGPVVERRRKKKIVLFG